MTTSRSRVTVRIALAALALSAMLGFTASASAGGFWGAIAVDPDTGILGKSFDFPTARSAQHQAIDVCEVRGDGCKVAVWVTNGWAALVKKHSGVYIGGLGRTKVDAIHDAKRRAHEANAHLITTVFSG